MNTAKFCGHHSDHPPPAPRSRKCGAKTARQDVFDAGKSFAASLAQTPLPAMALPKIHGGKVLAGFMAE
jgi:hypothetical protein